MAVTLKENSGRSRSGLEGPAGSLLQSSWDPRTQDRHKTHVTGMTKAELMGIVTDCIRGGSGDREEAQVLLRLMQEWN